MTKKKHFENCGRTEGRKDGRTTDVTPWHKLIGPFGPDELKKTVEFTNRSRDVLCIAEADPGSVERGARESKFLDAAPENNKNRPKKQKSAQKRGGRGRFDPPPPWIRHCIVY